MKYAILILPDELNMVQKQQYLIACIEKVTNDGYLVLIPDSYNRYKKLITLDYIQKVIKIISVIYFFTDFGINELMLECTKLFSNTNIEIKRENFTLEQIENFYISPANILKEISNKTGFTIDELKINIRKREIVQARQAYFCRAREKTKCTYAKIGSLVGRGHATVIWGIGQIKTCPQLIDYYNKLYPKKNKEKSENTNYQYTVMSMS
jgi:hypothetical protein